MCLSDKDPQSQENNENPCLYHSIYEDKSHSDGVIVKANIQMRIIDLLTGVGSMHLSEAYLG